MFERYTESARRTIFFARYEASQSGARQIESVHLLSGLLRQDRALFRDLLGEDAAVEGVRRELDAMLQPAGEEIHSSVDLPLSRESKHVLHHALEEADRMNHRNISCEHLLIGLLRMPGSSAAQTLNKFGMDLDRARREAETRNRQDQPVEADPNQVMHTKTQAAMGMARAGSQHSTYRFENGEMVVETDRAYFGHHIIVTERIRISEDGKMLIYRQSISGPGGRTGEYEIEFDLPVGS